MVVAVPLAPVVQRDQEGVGDLDLPQQPRGATRAGHGVAEGGAEPFQDRGGEEEVVDLGGEAREHLGGQVVDDVALVPGEGLDELLGVLPAAQRQSSEIEARRPAFGPVHEP